MPFLGKFEGASPLQTQFFPLSFEGVKSKGESKRGEASLYYRESKRDGVPFKKLFPLPLHKGKGDTGGWGY